MTFRVPPRPPPDDASINDTDVLLRFVPPNTEHVKHWTSEEKPTSAALIVKPSERGPSFSLLSILSDLGLDDRAPLKGRPGYGLIAIQVAALRTAGFGIVRDPVVSEPPREDDPAHCLVLYPLGLDKPELKLLRDSLLQAANVRYRPGSTTDEPSESPPPLA